MTSLPPLTRKQRDALDLLRKHDGIGSATPDATQEDAYECWINQQTAKALERRGLIEIDRADEWAIQLLGVGA